MEKSSDGRGQVKRGVVEGWGLNVCQELSNWQCCVSGCIIVMQEPLPAVHISGLCGMSVLVATTTYDFIAGRRKLFWAGCACWIPGGAFCILGSWLAVGRNCGPEKGRRAFFFWYSRAVGWTPGGALCVAASWLAWLSVLQYGRAAVFFAAAWFSLRQRLSAGDRAFYRGPLAEWSLSRAVSRVGGVAATGERWRCWRSLAEPVAKLLMRQTFTCR
jgi:hypothetical protein